MLEKLLAVLSHDYMDIIWLAAFIAVFAWNVRRQSRTGARQTAFVDDSTGTPSPPVLMDSPRDEYKSAFADDRVNPATGLTASGGSCFDSGGNLYGTSNNDIHR